MELQMLENRRVYKHKSNHCSFKVMTGLLLLMCFVLFAHIYAMHKPPPLTYEVVNQPCPILNKDKKVCVGGYIAYEAIYNKYFDMPAYLASTIIFEDGTRAVLPAVTGLQGKGKGIKSVSSNTLVPFGTPLKKGYLQRMAQYQMADGKVSYSKWITEPFEIVECTAMEKKLEFR